MVGKIENPCTKSNWRSPLSSWRVICTFFIFMYRCQQGHAFQTDCPAWPIRYGRLRTHDPELLPLLWFYRFSHREQCSFCIWMLLLFLLQPLSLLCGGYSQCSTDQSDPDPLAELNPANSARREALDKLHPKSSTLKTSKPQAPDLPPDEDRSSWDQHPRHSFSGSELLQLVVRGMLRVRGGCVTGSCGWG